MWNRATDAARITVWPLCLLFVAIASFAAAPNWRADREISDEEAAGLFGGIVVPANSCTFRETAGEHKWCGGPFADTCAIQYHDYDISGNERALTYTACGSDIVLCYHYPIHLGSCLGANPDEPFYYLGYEP